MQFNMVISRNVTRLQVIQLIQTRVYLNAFTGMVKNLQCKTVEGEGEFAVFSAKPQDRKYRAGLFESATPCHDALVVGSYWVSSPVRLTVLAGKSDDYTTARQPLKRFVRLLL